MAIKIIKWHDHRNYSTNPIIDAYLLNCLESGIKAMVYYTEDDKFAGCEFNNGIFYKFWNVNMPYAWLSEGRFVKNFNIIFQYYGSMPSRKVMNKFYNAMYEFLLKKKGVDYGKVQDRRQGLDCDKWQTSRCRDRKHHGCK